MTPTEAVCNTLKIAAGDGPVYPPCCGDLIDALIREGMSGHEIACVLGVIEDTFWHLPRRTMARAN